MKLKKFRIILFFFKKIFIVITEQQFIPQTKDLWDFLLSLFKIQNQIKIKEKIIKQK